MKAEEDKYVSSLDSLRGSLKSPKVFFVIFFFLFLLNSFWELIRLANNTLNYTVFLFISSFLLSLILTPSMVEMSKIAGIVDRPDEERKMHKAEIALLGGVAIALSFIGAILLSENSFPHRYKVLMVAAFFLAFTGLIDDILRVPAKIRLLVQFFLALWVIDEGISLRLFPAHELWGKKLNEALTLIWIVGFTNAYNFIDGLDGLAAGLGIIIAFFISCVSLINGQPEPLLLTAPFAGALFGFLIFNFHPAWIFLGDVGAQFCGFVLSSLAADTAWASPGYYGKAILGPALVMWVLLFDMVQITFFRIKYGFVKNLSDWIAFTGKDHIHHRFLFLFRSHGKTVLFIYLLSAVLSSFYLFVSILKLQDIYHFILIIIFVILSLFLMYLLDVKTSHLAFQNKKVNI